eukprot:NODE_20_length_2541_cov_4.463082_g17_i0.p1 GENE.NODE_20_length_2541_cov_4.463082_g17_i0~~NODE_20_length_2541_cov_4.463082_g17_i0.p1  ORF type:complete len:279 (-),score=69.77 NODE_20_length_2541_cov_4.463082_g17_i0:1443-2279(-)
MLARTLLRMLTVQVLAGVDALQDHVEDSLIPEPDGGKDAKWPDVMASVYTETADYGGGAGSGRVTILLAIELIAGVEADAKRDGEVLVLPKRMTPKAEFICDMIEDDIRHALNVADSDWADLWRSFCSEAVGEIKSYCGVDAQGRKRAMRRIEMRIKTYAAPQRGQPLAANGIWHKVLTALALEGTPAYQALALAIRKIIEGDGSVKDWAVALEKSGLDRQSARLVGYDVNASFDRTAEADGVRFVRLGGAPVGDVSADEALQDEILADLANDGEGTP